VIGGHAMRRNWSRFGLDRSVFSSLTVISFEQPPEKVRCRRIIDLGTALSEWNNFIQKHSSRSQWSLDSSDRDQFRWNWRSGWI
jgi:hypothetical protein